MKSGRTLRSEGKHHHRGLDFARMLFLMAAGFVLPTIQSRAASFITTGAPATDRQNHTATLLPNGKVLAAGGNTSSPLSSAEIYDPATGFWPPAPSMTTTRASHSATLLPNGTVLVVGGLSLFGAHFSAEICDPKTGGWSLTGGMHTNRANHTATLLPNGKVLVCGGGFFSNAEIYDPLS